MLLDRLFKKPQKQILRFIRSSNAAGKLLMLAAAVSLILANLPAIGQGLEHILSYKIGGVVDFRYIVNDVFMAFFFLLVGLEIKREFVKGELSSLKNASLPIVAALGGVVFPAMIYFFFNDDLDTEKGWAIPLATDIAFSLTIISLLSDVIPKGLRIILASLAIVDDVIGIIVIALFYSTDIEAAYLLYALIATILIALLNVFKIKSIPLYLVGGVFIWIFFHEGGIHPTLSGVLTAFMIPSQSKNDKGLSPLVKLEHILERPVGFFVMPIFAFVNTNILIEASYISSPNLHLFAGIFFGLVLGKPIGIAITSWLALKANISALPKNIKWGHIVGLGFLAGIGFTVSIFISILSFDDAPAILAESKIYIILASVVSALLGMFWLKYTARN